MSALPSYFRDFLAEIRLTPSQVDELKSAHKALRRRLEDDPDLAPLIVSIFLHGSYRRGTAVRPKQEKRSDVDVIVVTSLDRQTHTPADVLEIFQPFFEKHYPETYEPQGRSIGIKMKTVDLDVVVTSAPSEAAKKSLRMNSVVSEETLEEVFGQEADWLLNEFWVPLEKRNSIEAQSRLYKAARTAEWTAEPLWIPDRDVQVWQTTHPLAQMVWTRNKNRETSGHYINVVKAIKWWRRAMAPLPEHPKGYPLEHLIGDCCPSGIKSVAEGVTRTLEEVESRFKSDALSQQTPFLCDRGVSQNVMKRVDGEDFAKFHAHVGDAAALARKALESEDVQESARLWRDLFGEKFPPPPDKKSDSGGGSVTGGFSERTNLGYPPDSRFA